MSVQVHLCIDVSREGDAITGTVTAGNGATRNFTGRLGLFSTIDEEIERIAPDQGRQPEGQQHEERQHEEQPEGHKESEDVDK